MERLPFPPADDVLAIAPRYRELQDDEPVAPVHTAVGDPAWLVTRHADVTALFGDERLGRSHPEPERAARVSASVLLGGPVGDHDTERARHRRMRALLTPAFSARRMRALQPRIAHLVDRLLDELPAPPADWHDVFSVPLPVMVICELLGVPYADHPRFRRWATELTSLTDPDLAGAARDQLVGYVRDLIPDKRRTPGEDVISDLVAAQREAALTDDDIADLSAMLLFAGHETTVTRIDLGILLLLDHPEALAALRADPALADGAVEEILRLSALTTTGGLPRYAHDDIAVGGTTLPAGSAVLLATHAANRDHRVFPDPDAFDITRRPNPHLSFGHGFHYCVGASLARIELREVFSRVPARLPGLRLAVPRDAVRLRHDRLTGGLAALPVTW
ncbi:cytochrome P450 [Streptantibioticus cattleyicolor]|uniref:Cytochrome P-450 n=1 Tax=Streptantibioticus cattleyicolor (strain ATCC 35852 / DSM 46488 / JCM 4925 / NBRC 14057 / NRRL 8057) TaxID=1003195 RepID=F8JK89_STREN|nr:cytochrome P450 [Streptantibioticus cattleyicolor]AEW98551.1 cytochrome P-450 [Streptantibioticus cattleyicolor NRRL 8057 = DSM 46488]CCB72392.1 Cytochrome P450 [Streptantibioticus cattleyicolor NRRL 8057 = DSM 46488]